MNRGGPERMYVAWVPELPRSRTSRTIGIGLDLDAAVGEDLCDAPSHVGMQCPINAVHADSLTQSHADQGREVTRHPCLAFSVASAVMVIRVCRRLGVSAFIVLR